MAYPVVESTASTEVTTDGTSHTITMPSGIVAGNLLLAFVTVDGDTTFTHTGWRKIADQAGSSGGSVLVRHLLLARRAAGSDTLTVGTTASESLSAVVYRISGASGMVELDTARTSTADSSPNSPAETPSWGSADTLWIASVGYDDGTTTISSYPTGWSGSQVEASANNAGSTGTGVCAKTSTATSENPAAWTLSASEAHAEFTVAVQPSTTAIAFVGNGVMAADSTAGGTATPPLPPDWKVGDFAVLLLGARYESTHLPNEPSVSAGWTKQGTYAMYEIGAGSNSPYLAVYTRVLESGDTDPTVTNVNNPNLPNEATYSFIMSFTGVDTTTPIDVTPVGSNAVAATTWTPTGLTTNTNAAMVVSAVSMADNNDVILAVGSEQGFTLRYFEASLIGNDMTVAAATKLVATAGSVTCPTWEQTSLGPDHWAGMTFALKPTSGATVTGTAAGSATGFSGTAIGTPTTFGTAAGGAPSGTGTVTATRTVSGAATGSASGAGTALGTRTTAGSGAATGSGAGAVVGTRTVSGTAAGAAGPGAGAASGSVQGQNSAAGPGGPGAGTAVGTRTVFGAAAGGGSGDGTIVGLRTVAGVAAGAAVGAGAATGAVVTPGSVVFGSGHAPHVEVSGTVVGTRTVFGVGYAPLQAFYGFVNGTRSTTGTGVGAMAGGSGAAIGTRTRLGVATGSGGGGTGQILGSPHTPVTVSGVAAGSAAGAGTMVGRKRDPLYDEPSPFHPSASRHWKRIRWIGRR